MKSSQSKSGFTIVEVLLVTSITSLMLVGMLAGWNINIKRQQYNDSVESFKSDIQGIFDNVENMANDRIGKIKCYEKDGRMVAVTDTSNPNGERGMTNCVLLGKIAKFGDRYVQKGDTALATSALDVDVYDVIGKDINPQTDCGTDTTKKPCSDTIEALKYAKPTILDKTHPNYTFSVQWGGSYKNVTNNKLSKFGDGYSGYILDIYNPNNHIRTNDINSLSILRSPIDNTLVAFGANFTTKETNNILRVIDNKNILREDKTVDICIRPSADNLTRIIKGSSVFGESKNRVIRIGNSSASVQIAPLDGGSGTGSMSCGNEDGQGDVLFEGKKI